MHKIDDRIAVGLCPPTDARRPAADGAAGYRPVVNLLLHGYRPEQVDHATGGPPHRENIYTEALLREAFAEMEILHLAAYDRVVVEGQGHVGMSALIDRVARKPSPSA